MRNSVKMLALAIVLGMSACAPTVSVRSDYDRSAKFGQFQTYTIEADPVRNNDPVMGSALNRKRIIESIDLKMKGMGYVRQDNNPDLMIMFGTDSRDRQQIQSNNYGPMFGWGYWGGMNNNVSSRTYEENRIIVSVYNAQTKEMVWQGWASGQLNDGRKDRDLVIRSTAMKIMDQFPERFTADSGHYRGGIGR
ncbi:MAG: DUF4136 domain-containing protein [Spirosomataceae bacterium]